MGHGGKLGSPLLRNHLHSTKRNTVLQLLSFARILALFSSRQCVIVACSRSGAVHPPLFISLMVIPFPRSNRISNSYPVKTARCSAIPLQKLTSIFSTFVFTATLALFSSSRRVSVSCSLCRPPPSPLGLTSAHSSSSRHTTVPNHPPESALYSAVIPTASFAVVQFQGFRKDLIINPYSSLINNS
jgi:hypothetical protein